MKVKVVVVGRVRGRLEGAVDDFETRAAHYWKLEVSEVAAGAKGSKDAESVRSAEAGRILKHLAPGDIVACLTRDGRGMTSRELSAFLGKHALAGTQAVAFVIGGAFGLSPEVLGRARVRLALSSMTLPHELARVVLAEQLYRAGSIARGEPYHKGP